MGRFTGKTAVVTGAGSGIGLATATELIQGEARVVGVDMSQPRLDEAREELGQMFVPVVADITRAEAPQEILEAADGKVDILINNAGIMDGFVPVAEVDDDHWDLVLSVNLTAPMRLIRAFLPVMTVRGQGYIVNLSSEASLRSSASGVAYSVSKYGINALTRHVAVMYRAQGIRCNAVAPGGVQTNVAGEFRSGLAQRVLGPVMGAMATTHLASPKQIADVICFLCDEQEASNVNGAVIPVDGGWSAI